MLRNIFTITTIAPLAQGRYGRRVDSEFIGLTALSSRSAMNQTTIDILKIEDVLPGKDVWGYQSRRFIPNQEAWDSLDYPDILITILCNKICKFGPKPMLFLYSW